MIVSVAFFWVPSTAPELGLESVSETVSFSLTRGATYEPLGQLSPDRFEERKMKEKTDELIAVSARGVN